MIIAMAIRLAHTQMAEVQNSHSVSLADPPLMHTRMYLSGMHRSSVIGSIGTLD